MKRAVCIGLNYEGSGYALPDCHIDATEVAKRAMSDKFGVSIFTHVFTVADFVAELVRFREVCKKTDTTLISYSGHGTQYPTADESDRLEEGFCFWNGQDIEVFPDDDFRLMVEQIPGKVVLFIDSCFSGGMSRNVAKPGAKTARFVPYQPSFKVVRPNDSRNLQKAALAKGNKSYWLFASKESEVSWSTGEGGLFTRSFCAGYDKGKQRRTIKNLMNSAAAICGDDQTPNYQTYGGNASKLLF